MVSIRNYAVDAWSHWQSESAPTKLVILAALCLVVAAYLPTLLFDYVPHDQWRAFRYSTLGLTAYDRMAACIAMLPKFYVATGRPLVWMSECVEHALVSKISDFSFFRPLVLCAVLVTIVYLGRILAPMIGGFAMGVLAAACLVMAPGYSFMFLQGMPALTVLISLVLATASFGSLRSRLEEQSCLRGMRAGRLVVPFLLFVSSCLIYPIWGFLVIALAWLAFGLNGEKSWSARVRKLVVTLSFYFVSAIVYLALVKVSARILNYVTEEEPDLGPYAVALQLSPDILSGRVLTAAKYLYEMPPLNFVAPPGVMVVVLGAFSAILPWRAYRNGQFGFIRAVAASVLSFILGGILLLASISPWLFSQMENLSTRHLISWYLFFCVALAGLLHVGVNALPPGSRRFAPAFALVVCMLPVALAQNRLSIMEVAVSETEIAYLRLKVGQWIDHKGYLDRRYVVFVRPASDRPMYVEKLLAGARSAGENAVLSSSQSPAAIPWMFNALLRERSDHPVGKTTNVVVCGFDQFCASRSLARGSDIVLGITNADMPIKSAVDPFLINISTITSRPVNPVVERIALPEAGAGSNQDVADASAYLFHTPPGWVVERDATIPQTLTIDLLGSKPVKAVGILAQAGNAQRAPGRVRVRLSNDRRSWVTAAEANKLCATNPPYEWRSVRIPGQPKARYVEVSILANCGDPSLVTVSGLKIE